MECENLGCKINEDIPMNQRIRLRYMGDIERLRKGQDFIYLCEDCFTRIDNYLGKHCHSDKPRDQDNSILFYTTGTEVVLLENRARRVRNFLNGDELVDKPEDGYQP